MDAVEPVHASKLVFRALDVGGVGAKLGAVLEKRLTGLVGLGIFRPSQLAPKPAGSITKIPIILPYNFDLSTRPDRLYSKFGKPNSSP